MLQLYKKKRQNTEILQVLQHRQEGTLKSKKQARTCTVPSRTFSCETHPSLPPSSLSQIPLVNLKEPAAELIRPIVSASFPSKHTDLFDCRSCSVSGLVGQSGQAGLRVAAAETERGQSQTTAQKPPHQHNKTGMQPIKGTNERWTGQVFQETCWDP